MRSGNVVFNKNVTSDKDVVFGTSIEFDKSMALATNVLLCQKVVFSNICVLNKNTALDSPLMSDDEHRVRHKCSIQQV